MVKMVKNCYLALLSIVIFDCTAMDPPILEEGTPIKFHYGCSDIKASYEVFFARDTTLKGFYEEMLLLGGACRDLRVLIPGSDCAFNMVEFFFYERPGLYTSFCANHNTKVSSLAGEIAKLLVLGVDEDEEEIFDHNLENSTLGGVKVTYHDNELKKGGLGHFLQYNMQQNHTLDGDIPEKTGRIPAVKDKPDYKPTPPKGLVTSGPVELYYGYSNFFRRQKKFCINETSLRDFIDEIVLINNSNFGVELFVNEELDNWLMRFTFSPRNIPSEIYVPIISGVKAVSFIMRVKSQLCEMGPMIPLENYFLKRAESFSPKKNK
ncbi:MAG: hypothetical protein LBT63_03445 [Holosporaceae bacterium]|jgi:hypothetical protein|nr:hypothetical protein [Holosporaceae bacterium]